MNRKIAYLILFGIILCGAACGGSTDTSTAEATAQATAVPVADAPVSIEPTAPAADSPADTAVETTTGCEEWFQFCNTVRISGTVNAEGTAGIGGSGTTCAAWAAAGDTRVLEMPFMLASGDNPITVALTRIGEYTGPGSYTVMATKQSGNPDSFPAIDVDGRTFSNGEGSTAVITVAADGSGSVEAVGLVELASINVSNPDPEARIDFSMQWICQE